MRSSLPEADGVTPSPVALATADGRVFTIDRSNRIGLTVVNPLATVAAPGERSALPRRPMDVAFLRSVAFEPETALHRVTERVFVATSANDAELVGVAVQPGAPPAIQRVVDLPGSADVLSVVVQDELVVAGRRRSREHELVVLESDGAVRGGLDLPESIRAIEGSSGLGRASGRRWTYLVDVAGAAQPVLLATVPRDSSPLPPIEVARTEDFVTDGPMAYLATHTRGADLQAVDLDLAFAFPDVNSDGVRRLGSTRRFSRSAPTTRTWSTSPRTRRCSARRSRRSPMRSSSMPPLSARQDSPSSSPPRRRGGRRSSDPTASTSASSR